MATGVCRVLSADVSVAVTGVAGPDPQDGQEPGTVWMATCVDG
jgi:nicotinamide-nucleotide amidase